jgi:hypothetical protein
MAQRRVTVFVIINSNTDIRLQSADVPVVQDFIVEFDNNQTGAYSPGFIVDFSLPAGFGQNANWTFNPQDPIWVKLVDKRGACPRNQNAHQPGILTDPTLSAGNRILTVGNANAVAQYFGFALRFVNQNGQELTYDPIGNNQNGPQ